MSDLVSSSTTKFNGANWEDLNRLIALAKFKFLVDDEYWVVDDGFRTVPDNAKRSAHLASQFEGAALDWVASTYGSNPQTFDNFEGFITAVRQGFGVADDNIRALCRAKLDELAWGAEVPSFFAELDRLFLALGIGGHDTRIAHVTSKLPPSMKLTLADQGRMFHNYDTMREFLNTRWALMPKHGVGKKATIGNKRQKCKGCGKKGHSATECRSAKN
jgi:hypothetical protein